jgi:hypothetical protein
MADVRYDDFGCGFSYLLDDRARRTSHALADGGRVWLVDPVDVPEAIERARGLGEPAAVLQLLDRHNRDCAALSARLGVPHLRLPAALPGTPFEVLRVTWWRGWREIALWWPQQRTLAVAEAVGTLPLFTAGRELTAGVHPVLRLLPPDALRGYEPDHLLVGHGAGIHGARAAGALDEALARSRSDLPRMLARLPSLLRS